MIFQEFCLLYWESDFYWLVFWQPCFSIGHKKTKSCCTVDKSSAEQQLPFVFSVHRMLINDDMIGCVTKRKMVWNQEDSDHLESIWMSRGRPLYRVWGKNLYRLLVRFSHAQVSLHFGEMVICPNLETQENPYFSAFLSMPMKKDLGGIASVKVSFSMRFRIRGFAHNRMDGLASRQWTDSHSLWGSFPQLLSALFWANFREFSLVLFRFSLYSLCSQPVWYCFGIKAWYQFSENLWRKIPLFFFSKWYLALSYSSTGFDVWIQRVM